MTDQLMECSNRWEAAERNNDSAALTPLLHAGFAAVGPRGFVLNRQQWLTRYESGLHNNSFEWTDVTEREFANGVGLLIGTQTQASTYMGRPSNGSFRVTQVWLNEAGNWQLASIQLSEIAPPIAA